MIRFNRIFFLLALLSSCSTKINQYTRKKEKKGRWITYTDASKSKKLSEGKYRNGNPIGTWYYYNMNGELERKERKRGKKLITTNYYPGTKNIYSAGRAKIKNTPEKIHYYYYGKWKYLNSTGEPIKFIYYEKGHPVKTEYISKNNKLNDTLITHLMKIDEHFKSKNANFIDSVNHCWSNPKLAEKYIQKIYLNDSVSSLRIEKIFAEFGYTDKELCGDNASLVPFYIISYSPIEIREKYLELFKAAASLGKMDKKTLCYYIDKIKITRGEKQVYSTQFYLSNRKNVYYPVIEPEKLNQRRTEMGLEPLVQ
ncbi:MAG: hypothetical protein IPM51_09550 [Sphingobacteriaceae bacterium]|nr:hypothetical protein [Sphingobacteriaceae bacterium]